MERHLSEISIKGFKSIRNLEALKLKDINILIGANGAGKSNFVEFFKMLRSTMMGNLDSFIEKGGGINDFLHNGPKRTKQIEASLMAGGERETFLLTRSSRETAVAQDMGGKVLTGAALGAILGAFLGGNKGAAWGGTAGAILAGEGSARDTKQPVEVESTLRNADKTKEAFVDIAPYHFQDTSAHSAMRTSEIIQDNQFLRMDAANIAPFLLRLKNEEPRAYDDIIEAIQTVAPFFKDFTMNVVKRGEKESVNLEWYQKGSENYPMQPHHLSDGTIRFICLATALLQPNPPAIIIIDELELGLHPFAISILAELIGAAAEKSQLIIATQSASLVDHFDPEDVIVANRNDGASSFRRLRTNELNVWLEDYTLGDLWRKNVFEGGPRYE
ncbi:AAA family ATPase [Pseudodesulfovibrio sp. JC047]|uniref:AAA family ATPase n=1 Tax=Pseudodesulfovibrio sp. JC047 TaxID=2683199 RepID=UPI0013CF9BBA|nr:AAA family ATPase [Pseudodesulfovibrio sp. JC047]NDV20223.1 AAA family ATPase [Pseudodesulfovibrio sp. JC047]